MEAMRWRTKRNIFCKYTFNTLNNKNAGPYTILMGKPVQCQYTEKAK